MAVCQVKIPSCTYYGEGSIAKLKEIIEKEDAKSIIVFTDKGIRATGLANLVTDVLDEMGAKYEVFDDLKPEPAYTDVENVVSQVDSVNGDFIIAIGGGSVMDAAKLTCVLKNAPYTIRDLLNDPTIARKYIRSFPNSCTIHIPPSYGGM